MSRRALTVDEKVVKQEAVVAKIKERYDTEFAVLADLKEQQEALQNKKILELIGKSGKPITEIVHFLEEDTAANAAELAEDEKQNTKADSKAEAESTGTSGARKKK